MTECKWLGSTELQACSHSFALSGSPMQTQPQAKRTTTGEALHLPLAPLQNSGYGLKTLRSTREALRTWLSSSQAFALLVVLLIRTSAARTALCNLE